MKPDGEPTVKTIDGHRGGRFGGEPPWIIAVALIPALLFFPYWTDILAVGDSVIEIIPHNRWFFSMIRQGRDPLWNPLLLGGAFLGAYPNAGIYNPLAWVNLVLPAWMAGNIQILLYYSLAGIGMYLFARALGQKRPGALLAGTLFMAATYMLSAFESILALGGAVWTGWFLAALENLRVARGYKNRIKWTMLAGIAGALQLTSGHTYAFMHTCLFAGVYVLFMAIFKEKGKSGWVWFGCPVLAIVIAVMIGAALFLPALELQRMSWRHGIDFETFVGAPPTLWQFLGNLVYAEAARGIVRTPFLGGVAILLAIRGAMGDFHDLRYRIMTFVALGSAVLILGDATPLPGLLYHVPVLNLIGGFQRYRLEFSICCSILAGAGINTLIKRRSWPLKIWATSLVTILAIAAAILFKTNPGRIHAAVVGAMVSLTVFAVVQLYLRRPGMNWLLAVALVLFLVEPYMSIQATMKLDRAKYFDPREPSTITRIVPVQKYSGPPPSRMFPVVDLRKHSMKFFYEIGAPNLSILQGIHNASGYYPLMSDRYGRLLDMTYFGLPRCFREIVQPPAMIMDLLQIEYVVIPREYIERFDPILWTYHELTEFRGIPLLEECYIQLWPGETVRFQVPETDVHGLAMVSGLIYSNDSLQGETALEVVLEAENGATREVDIRVGVDTAEMGHGKNTAHAMPTVFHDISRNGAGRFHNYFTERELETPFRAKWLTLRYPRPSGSIAVNAITLMGRDKGSSVPLTWIDHMLGDPARFEKIETAEAYVWRRKIKTPRAWLVSDAVRLPADKMPEIVKTGSFRDGSTFDPWATALLEEGGPGALLPGGRVTGSARVVRYEPNEIALEATCDRSCVLVLSETWYPGWKARVDGQESEVFPVDYILRGVMLTPGKHEIELRFESFWVMVGRIISVGTLLSILILWVAIVKLGGTSKKSRGGGETD